MGKSDFEACVSNKFIKLAFGDVEKTIAMGINKDAICKGHVAIGLQRFVVA